MDAWRARVIRWRRLYPDPRFVKGKYDPSKARARPLICAKCGAREGVTRHHKGHEFLFACIAPEWYAARYIRFVESDWIPLCTNKCHKRIHEIYTPIVDQLKLYINECLASVEHEGENAVFIWNYRPSRRVLESFRKRLIARCDQWMKRKNKKFRPRKYGDYRC